MRQKQEASAAREPEYFIHPDYAAGRVALPFEPTPAPWQMVRRIRAALLRMRMES